MHTIEVGFELGPAAKPVFDALQPETQALPSERSKVTLEQSGGRLLLFVKAEDLVSLRAALNTWLRLVKIAEDMFNTRVIS